MDLVELLFSLALGVSVLLGVEKLWVMNLHHQTQVEKNRQEIYEEIFITEKLYAVIHTAMDFKGDIDHGNDGFMVTEFSKVTRSYFVKKDQLYEKIGDAPSQVLAKNIQAIQLQYYVKESGYSRWESTLQVKDWKKVQTVAIKIQAKTPFVIDVRLHAA